jgi:hypothetical protein
MRFGQGRGHVIVRAPSGPARISSDHPFPELAEPQKNRRRRNPETTQLTSPVRSTTPSEITMAGATAIKPITGVSATHSPTAQPFFPVVLTSRQMLRRNLVLDLGIGLGT